MNKFAIYTAVVGNYDEISQPLVVDSRFDYFLFSDTIRDERIGVWQVRPINYINPDKVKIARYVKTHPETLLPEYTATLWMDANIQVTDSWVYERFMELYSQACLIASVKHPERDCIYKEMFAVCSVKWETIETAWRWNHYLRKHKYPNNNGLFETNILYRSNSSVINKIDGEWWSCIEQYSRRDQFSFNFVLWHNQQQCAFFLQEGECALHCSHVRFIDHNKPESKFVSESEYICFLWDYYDILLPYKKAWFYEKWFETLSLPLWLSRSTFYLWKQNIRIKRILKRLVKMN